MVEGYVAECFWPGVTRDDVELLDRRVASAIAEPQPSSSPVRYLGSLLLAEDEVVLCCFDGEIASVEAVATLARVPYERLLTTFATGWDRPRGAVDRTPSA
jgi:hypothetical protein